MESDTEDESKDLHITSLNKKWAFRYPSRSTEDGTVVSVYLSEVTFEDKLTLNLYDICHKTFASNDHLVRHIE